MRTSVTPLTLLSAALLPASLQAADDPLPSWNDGPAKASILRFVAEVTDKGSAGYVAPAERMAVFDNDGTLWPEQPVYTQFLFGMDMKQDWRRVFPFENE